MYQQKDLKLLEAGEQFGVIFAVKNQEGMAEQPGGLSLDYTALEM